MSHVSIVGDSRERLTETSAIVRDVVFDTGKTVITVTRLAGGAATEWHRHGERALYEYVLRGDYELEYGTASSATVRATADEFVRVPQGLVHRDVNRGERELVVLAAAIGQGPVVTDIAGPTGHGGAVSPAVAGRDDLVPTAPLPNLTREMPFPDAPVQQVRGHADGQIESGWHHHGDNDVFGYVIEGEGYVEWGTGEDERALARAGDFFHIPAGLVHRDVNPSDDAQEYVLWLDGTEPRNVTVERPE